MKKKAVKRSPDKAPATKKIHVSGNLFHSPIDKSSSGYKIRELRLKHGLTQGALAKMVGLTTPGVSNIESDIRSLTLDGLRDFAKALSVPVVNLLPGNELSEVENDQKMMLDLRSALHSKEQYVLELQRKVINLFHLLRKE